MRAAAYVARFFVVVPVVPPLLTSGFVLAILTAVVAVGFGLTDPASALAPLFLVQLFAVSSGFAVPARRGHYDLVFTTGQSRWSILLLHAVVSIGPGLVSWLLIAAVEWATGSDPRAVTLASGTWMALFTLSTIAWAATVPLPRLTGAIGWLLVLVSASVVAPPEWRDLMTSRVSADRPSLDAMVVTLCPFVLVGRRLSMADLPALMPALGLATGAMAAACVWVERTDVPLEATQ